MDRAAADTLRIVLREEEPLAIQQLKLDLERSRMEKEDLRSAAFSPYGNNRLLTWKEVAKDRNDVCDRLVFQVIEPAVGILEEARAAFRTNMQTGASTQPVALCDRLHNEVVRAEAILREEESEEEMEEDSEASDGGWMETDEDTVSAVDTTAGNPPDRA